MDTVSVRMIVDDTDAAVDFWKGHFGFEVVMHPSPAFAMLAAGNLRLLLNRPGAGGAGVAADDGATPAPGGWNRLQVPSEDLDADLARLRAAKVTVRTSIVAGGGGRQAVVEDPSGNPVELFEAPTA